jgi:hypothetical protein
MQEAFVIKYKLCLTKAKRLRNIYKHTIGMNKKTNYFTMLLILNFVFITIILWFMLYIS